MCEGSPLPHPRAAAARRVPCRPGQVRSVREVRANVANRVPTGTGKSPTTETYSIAYDLEVAQVGAVGDHGSRPGTGSGDHGVATLCDPGETCACAAIMADRTALGSIRGPAARAAVVPAGPRPSRHPCSPERSG